MHPQCPNCGSTVDIRPAYKAYNYKGAFPKGQGVRCRACKSILKFSRTRAYLVKFLPTLLLIPFIWYRDTSVMLRTVVGIIAVGPLLISSAFLFPQLFDLRAAEPFEDIESDDELFE